MFNLVLNFFCPWSCPPLPELKRPMWGEKDSNLRSRKTTDLQSVPFGHSGISPIHLIAIRTGAVFTTFSEEPMEGFEPPTH